MILFINLISCFLSFSSYKICGGKKNAIYSLLYLWSPAQYETQRKAQMHSMISDTINLIKETKQGVEKKTHEQARWL